MKRLTYTIFVLMGLTLTFGCRSVSVTDHTYMEDMSVKAEEQQIIAPDYRQNSHNALPPGPTRIWGTLTDKTGQPLSNARILVKYPDGEQRDADVFYSQDDGRFHVSVFRYDQLWVDLEISLNEEIIGTVRYENPGRGQNIGNPSVRVVVR